MAESPGKLLSSFASLDDGKGNTSKMGGCAGVFFHLLYRFNSKKSLPHKLLPSERPKHNTISHTEEKLPMAKLLLIADEKRIADLMKNKERDSDSQGNEGHQGQTKTPVSVIVKLMGLETMPSPKFSIESKQFEVLKEKDEAQSTGKPLQCKKLSVKRAQRNTNAMDIRMQTPKGSTQSSLSNHFLGLEAKVEDCNSVADALKQPSVRSKIYVKLRTCEITKPREGENPKTFMFSKFPGRTFQMECQLKSVLSPSRTSNLMLSPVKSPLSSRSATRLFGAAARVLEPNLRPARQLGFSPHNVKSEPCGNADESNEKPSTTLSYTKCRGQVTGKCLNSIPEKTKQLSPSHGSGNSRVIAKDGVRKNLPHTKPEKQQTKALIRNKQSVVSEFCRTEANDPAIGKCRLIPSSTCKKTFARTTHIYNRQEMVLVTGGDSKQEEFFTVQGPSISFTPSGSRSAKSSSNGTNSRPSRIKRSSQQLSSPPYNLEKRIIQEGIQDGIRFGFVNDSKATRLCKSKTLGAHGGANVVQLKRESSCSRSSSKRKASSLSPKPTVLSNVAGAGAGNFELQNVANERRPAHETQSMFPQSNPNVPMVSFDDCSMTSSIEADARGSTRGRAKWDIADERKKNSTLRSISCSNSDDQLPTCSSVSNILKGDNALETSEATIVLLQESLLTSTSQPFSPQLGTPETKPSLCSGVSKTFQNGPTGLLNDCFSNIDSYLGGAIQQSRNHDNLLMGEDSSVQDTVSIAGSFCAEECEQPSPISILESPFHDSASCSSDSFEAPQGHGLWEAIQNESKDYVSAVVNHVEDLKSSGILTHTSHLRCIESGSSDGDGKTKVIMEHEDRYVKKVLGIVLHSAESSVWERSTLSVPLIDPLIYHQLEENHLFTQRARMHTVERVEFEHERDERYTRTDSCFTPWCKGGSPIQRQLFFDCIEAALKMSLELAIMKYYGFLIPCIRLPPAYLQKSVYQHLGEWKGLSFSMNLDDMMKAEINSGMGRWFKHGDEVEVVAADVEAVIFNCLIDELTKDVLKDVQGSAGSSFRQVESQLTS